MEVRTVKLAVMFAEVMGATAVLESLGESVGWSHLRACLDMMRGETAKHGGTYIKTIGGAEIMCSFPDASSAVEAAVGIEERLQGEFPSEVEGKPAQLSVRIGVNYGELIPKDNDVFGDSVNVAARMMQAAKGDQILVTGDVLAALPGKLRSMTRLVDKATVKGKQIQIEIHEVVWEEEGATRIATNLVRGGKVVKATLKLRHRDKVVEMNQDSRGLVLGRGAQADLRIDDEDASRMHLKIEFQRGKFVVMDDSVNGTYLVTPQGELRLRKKETYTLSGKGLISLGRQPADNPEVVNYECDA